MPSLATPLLETMGFAARVAYPFITMAAEGGLGANEMINLLREIGVPTFRRADMLALFREATGAALLRSDIARLPHDVLMAPERVRTAVTRTVAQFGYTLAVQYVDAITGQVHERHLSASSEELLPFSEVEQAMLEGSIPGQGSVSGYISDATVIDVYQAGTMGVL